MGSRRHSGRRRCGGRGRHRHKQDQQRHTRHYHCSGCDLQGGKWWGLWSASWSALQWVDQMALTAPLRGQHSAVKGSRTSSGPLRSGCRDHRSHKTYHHWHTHHSSCNNSCACPECSTVRTTALDPGGKWSTVRRTRSVQSRHTYSHHHYYMPYKRPHSCRNCDPQGDRHKKELRWAVLMGWMVAPRALRWALQLAGLTDPRHHP